MSKSTCSKQQGMMSLVWAVTRNSSLSPATVARTSQFLSEVDMVVIMVKHDHIKQNWDKLKGKVILDCHNICPIKENVYHI